MSTEVANLMEMRMVMLLRWTNSWRENGHVSEVAILMDGEWSSEVTEVVTLLEGVWSCYGCWSVL